MQPGDPFCEGLPCWRFVHARGTGHFDGAFHKEGRYVYFSRCAQCGVSVGPHGEPTQRVAAHVMGYPCGPCNCCCARLTLKTTCKHCNDLARRPPSCFYFFDHRFTFVASAPLDASGDRVLLNVPKDSGSLEGCCSGFVFQPACCMRDYSWADPGESGKQSDNRRRVAHGTPQSLRTKPTVTAKSTRRAPQVPVSVMVRP